MEFGKTYCFNISGTKNDPLAHPLPRRLRFGNIGPLLSRYAAAVEKFVLHEQTVRQEGGEQ